MGRPVFRLVRGRLNMTSLLWRKETCQEIIYSLYPAEAVMLRQDAQIEMEKLTQILQGPLFSREC
jgi:hypothetical protein